MRDPFQMDWNFFFFFYLVASDSLCCYLLHVYRSALQHNEHIAKRPGEYRTYDALQSLRFNLLMFLHGDVSVGHLCEESMSYYCYESAAGI